MSNFVFPLVAPVILWDLGRTYWDEAPGIPPEYHEWAASHPPAEPGPPPAGRGKRVLAALAAVVVAAVVLFFILPRVLR
jgi:hypothetical protein